MESGDSEMPGVDVFLLPWQHVEWNFVSSRRVENWKEGPGHRNGDDCRRLERKWQRKTKLLLVSHLLLLKRRLCEVSKRKRNISIMWSIHSGVWARFPRDVNPVKAMKTRGVSSIKEVKYIIIESRDNNCWS